MLIISVNINSLSNPTAPQLRVLCTFLLICEKIFHVYIFTNTITVGCWSAAVVLISLPARLKLCWDSPSLHGGASWFLALQLPHLLSIWLIFSSLHQIIFLLHVFLYWLKSWNLYTFCRQQNVILVNFWITASRPWKIQFYCYNTFYFISL